jgi:hypothetical protein
MYWLILIVAVLLVFGFWLLSSSGRYFAAAGKYYKDVVDTPHFVEVAEGVRSVRRGALEYPEAEGEDSPLTEVDPRVFVSSKGIGISYAITEETKSGEKSFVHHFAISLPNQTTPPFLGEFFAHYVAILLSLTDPPTAAFRSLVGVHHMEFILSPAEQEEWRQKTVPIPTEDTLPGIRERIAERREKFPFKIIRPPTITECFI